MPNLTIFYQTSYLVMLITFERIELQSWDWSCLEDILEKIQHLFHLRGWNLMRNTSDAQKMQKKQKYQKRQNSKTTK